MKSILILISLIASQSAFASCKVSYNINNSFSAKTWRYMAYALDVKGYSNVQSDAEADYVVKLNFIYPSDANLDLRFVTLEMTNKTKDQVHFEKIQAPEFIQTRNMKARQMISKIPACTTLE